MGTTLLLLASLSGSMYEWRTTTPVTKEAYMNVTDLDRYEMCMANARTCLMMARALKDRYGTDDASFRDYLRRGKESCYLAMKYRRLWEDDSTEILQLVA